MFSCNPYLTRLGLKALLVVVTLVLFLTHSWYLTHFRTVYIQRYMQYQMHAGETDDVPGINLSNMEEDHHHHQHQQHNHKNQRITSHPSKLNNETDVSHLNETSAAGDLPPPVISGGDEEFDDVDVYILPPLDKLQTQLREKVHLYSWLVLLVYVVIEIIQLIIYLVIIMRRRLCYLATLTVLSSIMLVNSYSTAYLNKFDEPQWMDGIHFGRVLRNPTTNETITFSQHVNSLNQMDTLTHLMMPTQVELVLATIETVLLIAFTIICIFYPEPYDPRQHHYNQILQRRQLDGEGGIFIPNGHHHPIRDDPEGVEMVPINRERRLSNNSDENDNAPPPPPPAAAPEVEHQVEASPPKSLNQVDQHDAGSSTSHHQRPPPALLAPNGISLPSVERTVGEVYLELIQPEPKDHAIAAC